MRHARHTRIAHANHFSIYLPSVRYCPHSIVRRKFSKFKQKPIHSHSPKSEVQKTIDGPPVTTIPLFFSREFGISNVRTANATCLHRLPSKQRSTEKVQIKFSATYSRFSPNNRNNRRKFDSEKSPESSLVALCVLQSHADKHDNGQSNETIIHAMNNKTLLLWLWSWRRNINSTCILRPQCAQQQFHLLCVHRSVFNVHASRLIFIYQCSSLANLQMHFAGRESHVKNLSKAALQHPNLYIQTSERWRLL